MMSQISCRLRWRQLLFVWLGIQGAREMNLGREQLHPPKLVTEFVYIADHMKMLPSTLKYWMCDFEMNLTFNDQSNVSNYSRIHQINEFFEKTKSDQVLYLQFALS
uniref:Putative secreted protein n=1 Tax=Panstrongylus lignarius TaxID=156445 RepID=A0A224Y2K8_9HEMI